MMDQFVDLRTHEYLPPSVVVADRRWLTLQTDSVYFCLAHEATTDGSLMTNRDESFMRR